MRQARATRPMRPAFAVLCLASLVAGCLHDGSASSTTPASTGLTAPQRTTSSERQETSKAKGQAPPQSEEQDSAQSGQPPTTGTERRSTAPTQTESPSESVYVLQPTLRCLERHPRLETTTRPTTARLQALRDLAQRTSVIAQLEGEDVGIAVVQSSAHAVLLAELLRAPDDAYRIIRRRNAVLFFLPRARNAFDLVAGCLRPVG